MALETPLLLAQCQIRNAEARVHAEEALRSSFYGAANAV
jgi:hypothetical protein